MIAKIKKLLMQTEEEENVLVQGSHYHINMFFFSILSGLIYLAVFYLFGYSNIAPSDYIDRDDGLISFSHAVNWKDYGFIGVSPSGERVEGYSTPVHFFLYFIFYSLFQVGYSTYISWQTVIGTFLLGCIFFNFFKNKPIAGLMGSIISSFLLSSAFRFLQWHGSGMENPISEVFILLTIYLLYKSVKDQNIKYSYAFVFAIASLSRIEYIYYVFPLLVLFLMVTWDYNYRVKTVLVILLTLSILFIIHALRIWYFGSFEPNTALAQGLNLKDQIIKTITLDSKYWRHSWLLARSMVMYNLGAFLVLAILFFCYSKRSLSTIFLILTSFGMLLLTFFHAFIFRGERLDPIRYGAHLAPVSVTALVFAFVNFKRIYVKHLFYLVPIVIFIAVAVLYKTTATPIDICCAAKNFEENKSQFLKLKEDNKIVRPSVANPDLGIVSYTKDFNMLDLAFLGSPAMAKLSSSQVLLKEYLFEVVEPDILESHAHWCCLYKTTFADERFAKKYTLYKELYSPCPPAGIYFRKDMEINSNSRERVFYEKIKAIFSAAEINKDSLAIIIRYETNNILSDSSIYSSMYINRTLFKFLPEIRQAGLLNIVLTELRNTVTYEYHKAYLTSNENAHWRDEVVKEFLKFFIYAKYNNAFPINKSLLKSERLSSLFDSKFLKAEKDYKLYYNKNILLYYTNTDKNIINCFYLRITPNNISDIPENERIKGYEVRTFNFKYEGMVIDNEYVMPVELPSYKVSKIEMGQLNGKDTLYKVNNTLWNIAIQQ